MSSELLFNWANACLDTNYTSALYLSDPQMSEVVYSIEYGIIIRFPTIPIGNFYMVGILSHSLD